MSTTRYASAFYISAFALASGVGALGLPARGEAQGPDRTPPATNEVERSELEQPAETIVVEPRAGDPRDLVSGSQRDIDAYSLAEPGFGSVVRSATVQGEQTDLADVASRSPGVVRRTLGGPGSFSAVSVRGADASHTAVFVDGVPLSRLSTATSNLGFVDLRSISRADLYRSGTSVLLPGVGVGGAIAIHTATGSQPEWLVSSGVGSFAARHLYLRHLGSGSRGRLGTHLAFGYAQSQGDFDYFNDNGTPLNRDDDAIARRANNESKRFDTTARVQWRGANTLTTAGLRGVARRQGVPGPTFDQSSQSSLGSVLALADAGLVRYFDGGGSARVAGFASHERQRFSDPDGEIGLLNQELFSTTQVVGARASAVTQWGRHQLGLGLDGQLDRYREEERLGSDLTDPRGHRIAAGLAAFDEVDFPSQRLTLYPGVRLDGLATRPTSDRFAMDTALPGRTDWLVSPRLAARVAVGDDVAAKGSIGRYARMPTLFELFGDSGTVLGNPELKVESGVSGDIGIMIAPDRRLGRVDRMSGVVAAFASRPKQTIVFAAQNGLVSRARNLDGAKIFGVEIGGSARWAERLSLAANYTWLDARVVSPQAQDGNRLPNRPMHTGYARADLADKIGQRLWVVWSDVSAASDNFLDESNVYQLPARIIASAGIKFEPVPQVLVGLDVTNLTDNRMEHIELRPAPRPDLARVPRAVTDFYGYPLPGRSVYLTLEWSLKTNMSPVTNTKP